ncbi:MAG: hypothetical protein HY951_00185 [Bacteroidia bacterium]|nr:hypothetical protein [Bacteroidia bacterium]
MSNIIQQGNWKVTLYHDSGTDETYYFNGYQFVFNSSGIIIASVNSNNTNGSWSSGNDDSTPKLILNFGVSSPLDKLNDDWHIIEQTSVTIRLQDVSGGNGTTDYLTFEKI